MRRREANSHLHHCARPAPESGGTGSKTGKVRFHSTSDAREKVVINL